MVVWKTCVFCRYSGMMSTDVPDAGHMRTGSDDEKVEKTDYKSREEPTSLTIFWNEGVMD